MTRTPPIPNPRAPHGAVPDWLQPLGAQAPCGASLEYDAEYAVLLSRMVPRGEAQYGKFVGTPEAPNWAEIERDCRRLLLRTKDINLFVWLCRARARLAQAEGLAQALAMLRAVLEAWPEAIHPQLLVEGEHDPAVRANALAALADPQGLMSDIRDIAVVTSTAMRLAVRDVERAFAVPRPAEAPHPEAVAQQLAALRQAAAGDDRAPVNALALAAREARAIAAWSKTHLGDDAPSLQPLLRLLDLFAPPAAAAGEGAASAAAQPASPEPPAAPAAPLPDAMPLPAQGQPATRAEVQRRIRAAREWFEHHEPSSPVAVLLRQAERMVGKRFSQVANAIPLDLLQKWESSEDGEDTEDGQGTQEDAA